MENYLKYKEYIGTVNFSSADEVFYGKVHGINDLVTFEGETVKELKNAFIESVVDYLKTCENLEKAPDKTFKGNFNVRVTKELHRQATLLASRKNITLNEFVKEAISYAISHENVFSTMNK
ncbi:MAG: type II toxin-antitoxin system HicB family antitoxin [Bacteroidetes bacterium]|jgi:predicted HicB family RNase H-like nuclease|nr:type II toxin-antitoxin system HicB family antitoxin [Bacteroidota bacterium]MBT6686515.1 type II toxin-antitoxin system HicB family antitoxin [Bacteroidota bacterium]MBT7144226.1 type II toxin-antitoxin system HicB family antitoxin [Bacteroidota bacterium]MBT7491358.1 type II toxin-antitoxin system HicB family antitoxin [Bacteroidota bacterium]